MTIIKTREDRIESIVKDWHAPVKRGADKKLTDKLQQLEALCKLGAIRSFEPLLPLCLNLNGKPMTLRDFYPFSPLFRIMQPLSWVLKTGRQLSKSQSMATSSVMFAAAQPHYKILHVCPMYEQIRRFSNNYIKPLIEGSPVRQLWQDTFANSSVLQRTFKNGSIIHCSFTSQTADRIRGLSVNRCVFDESQDLCPDIIPVVLETMSASIGFTPSSGFGGTPKQMSGPLQGLWSTSSQAEWVIQCRHCRYSNIPSLEFDLEKMIGPWHSGISADTPGTICAKCRKTLYPRDGRWIHRYPDKRWEFAGYHVSQTIMPMHNENSDRWSMLIQKQNGAGNMSRSKFLNEVCGESTDEGVMLVSETELRGASNLPWRNTPHPTQALILKSDEYHQKVLAVDWGGGGQTGTSFTAVAVLGYLPSGEVHVIWGKRLVQSQSHVQEALEIKHYFKMFNCHYLAHDYTGAGTIRETVMVQTGMPQERIIPVEYIGAASGQIMRFIPASDIHARNRYRLDKTRSLLNLCNAIRFKLVRFFEYDYLGTDNAGLTSDFLALCENKVDSRSGSDIYTITRNILLTDDFAQAVNIGCAAIWHSNKAWPDFSAAIQHAQLSAEQLRAVGSPEDSWGNDPATWGT